MPVTDNLDRSPVAFEEASTLVAVIDMSLSSWVVLGLVPGLQRRPEKKRRRQGRLQVVTPDCAGVDIGKSNRCPILPAVFSSTVLFPVVLAWRLGCRPPQRVRGTGYATTTGHVRVLFRAPYGPHLPPGHHQRVSVGPDR